MPRVGIVQAIVRRVRLLPDHWNEKGQIEILQEHPEDAFFNTFPTYPI